MVAALVGLGALTACEAILGIEDAELDPLLAGSGGGNGSALCSEYCDLVMSNCTDENSVYATRELCELTCDLLPEGEENGAEIGNTVRCRLAEARSAGVTGEPNRHCPQAGPGGRNVCGSDCEAYCLLFQHACGTTFEEQFLNTADCLSECMEYPDVGTYSVIGPMQEGPHVQCRLYHVTAATFDPGQHCPHAAGEPPCVDASGSGGAGGAGGGSSSVSTGVASGGAGGTGTSGAGGAGGT